MFPQVVTRKEYERMLAEKNTIIADLQEALELLVGRSDHSYFCDREFRDGGCECGYYKAIGSAQRAIAEAKK